MTFHDIAIQNRELESIMEDLGWSTEIFDVERNFIGSDDWGEVKHQVRNNEALHILESPEPELMRKAVKLEDLDAVLSPYRGRKDPGMNHVIAKAAEKNSTAVILSFKDLLTSSKKRVHLLSHWRTIINLSEKYGFEIILSTEAETENQLRNPKDLTSLAKTLEADEKIIKQNPEKLVGEYT